MSNNYQGISSTGSTSERMLNIGHGSFIKVDRILGIFEAGSLPMRRWRDKALEENRLVDATKGRKLKSLILTDSNHVILSSVVPQTLNERLSDRKMPVAESLRPQEERLFVS
jgi:extracellular matrix regulatory protein A